MTEIITVYVNGKYERTRTKESCIHAEVTALHLITLLSWDQFASVDPGELVFFVGLAKAAAFELLDRN